MKNIISGYRVISGNTQEEMAIQLGISRQSYQNKEKGKTPFNDKEKIIFTEIVKGTVPSITIEDIFFNHITKKYKENNSFDNKITH